MSLWRRRGIAVWACAVACLGLLGAVRAVAQDDDESEQEENRSAAEIRAAYTKYEYRIPMRDGAKLFTVVYVPKDASPSKTYPFLIERTPYSVAPYGPDNYAKRLGPAPSFVKDGFIFVYQDVRGRYQSEGDFLEMTPHKDVKKSAKEVDESTDTYDTIDWLLKNVANNNGKAGIYGISYPGFYAAAAMPDTHPALKACSPQAPVTDLYMGDDAYHNGAFMLAANFGFYVFFLPRKGLEFPPKEWHAYNYATTDGYEFYLKMGPLANARNLMPAPNWYWNDQVEHPNYDDYWKVRNISAHMKNIHCAVLTVGGLFDAEDLVGPVRTFQSVAAQSPQVPNRLVEGPWVHGGWAFTKGDRLGAATFGKEDNSAYFNDQVLLPFFRQYLKNAEDPKLPTALIFETGTNQWRRYDAWPPKNAQAKALYLHAGGKLSFEPANVAGFDEYVSDPAHPVPFIESIDNGVPRTYMSADQRFAAKRGDVEVYQTEPLSEDLTVAGLVSPRLWVSSTGTDSDFDVKLIDVYPMETPDPDPNPKDVRLGGYQQLVRGEPFRAKFRNSFEKPQPLEPGKPTAIYFELPSISHTFKRGHRIMVQIQSSWFPLTDRNPQKFVNIPDAKPDDFQKATERIYLGGEHGSMIILPVVPTAR